MRITTFENVKKLDKWDKVLIEKELKEAGENWDNFENITYLRTYRRVKYYINLKENPLNKLDYCFDSSDWNYDKWALKQEAKEQKKINK